MTEKKINLPYTPADFEGTADGKNTRMFTLENKNGMLVTLTNYGAKIVSIYVPDKEGNFDDIVLGFRSIDEYMKNSASQGAVVGPFANRIANAMFTLGKDTFHLPVNNGKACIHSGPASWYRKIWDYKTEKNRVEFTVHSKDGEFGFPGDKTAKVTYELTDNNELKLDYKVSTDKPCPINITNHSYFNLNGEGNGDVLNHVIWMDADKVTVINSEMIPTGEIAGIKGTPLDFTVPQLIADRINEDHPMLKMASGFDFNYIINRKNSKLVLAASAYVPQNGRFMEVFTTEPGVQFFTGNSLKGTEAGKKGVVYSRRTGFCFETQHFPDSPNHPEFPDTVVLPGKDFTSTTIFRFSVK